MLLGRDPHMASAEKFVSLKVSIVIVNDTNLSIDLVYGLYFIIMTLKVIDIYIDI